MVRILHIETATKVCSVGISQDNKLIAIEEETSSKYIHAERLTILIEKVMKAKNFQFTDLSAIAVTSGPGSYTGLRIGVSTAKGLCYAADLPLIAIETLDGIIEQAQEKYPDQNICAMIDARRMEVFSKIVDENGNVVKSLSADELQESSYDDFKPFIACGDGAEKCKEIWINDSVTFDNKIFSSIRGQVSIAHNMYKEGTFSNVAYFEPKYLKDFIAKKSEKKSF